MAVRPAPEVSTASSGETGKRRWFFDAVDQLFNGYPIKKMRGLFGFLFLGPFILPHRKPGNRYLFPEPADRARKARELLAFYREQLRLAPDIEFDFSVIPCEEAPVLQRMRHLCNLLCRNVSTPENPLSVFRSTDKDGKRKTDLSEYIGKTETYDKASCFCECFTSWAECEDRQDILAEAAAFCGELADYLLEGGFPNRENLCALLRKSGIPWENLSRDPGRLLLCFLLKDAIADLDQEVQPGLRRTILGDLMGIENLVEELPPAGAARLSLSEPFFSFLLQSLLEDFTEQRLEQLKRWLPDLEPDGRQLVHDLTDRQIAQVQNDLLNELKLPPPNKSEQLIQSANALIKLKQIL